LKRLYQEKKNREYIIQALLFVVTFIATTLAGAEWMYGKSLFYGESTLTFQEVMSGLHFSIPFLLILTVHEFGHYITARIYKVGVTLPYYIPFWLGWIPAAPSIGTMGAFIKINQIIKTRKEYFDIGIAGPLAGFVVAILVLLYGFTNLPPEDYVFRIHPEYAQYGSEYAQHVYQKEDVPSIKLGSSILFDFFEEYVVPEDQKSRIPNRYEMFHYPYLLAGYLALFFTALNLFPIGQLDGGHVVYGMLGSKRHGVISLALFIVFVTYAGIGIFSPHDFVVMDEEAIEHLAWAPVYIGFLYFIFYTYRDGIGDRLVLALSVFAMQFMISFFLPEFDGANHWLLFAFIIGRFLGIYHPPALYDQPLNTFRIVLGIIAMIIFVISFTPTPFVIDMPE
jgi:membrane-associated protease RseP (regulator of RpoE activity)